MPKWISVDANTDKLQDVLRDIADVLDAVVTLLNAVQNLVNAIAALILAFESAIKAILVAIITLIEQFILNVLETNAHIAFHSNLKYDKNWSWKPIEGRDNPNFIDGDVPFNGTGVSGWLGEIAASTYDETNIFRPITDTQTQVSGVIIMAALPTFNEAKGLIPIFQKVFDFSSFEIPRPEDEDGNETTWMKALKGYAGSRVEKLGEGFEEAGEAMKEMRSGLKDSFEDSMPGSLEEAFLNSPGPTWISAPVGAILGEGVRRMADALREFVNSFTFADSPIIQLLNAISEKIQHLEDLLSKISDIIDALADLLAFLDNAAIYAASEIGSAGTFFANAAQAKDVPNAGPNGFAVGGVALVTNPSMDSFKSLFEIFGAEVESAITGLEATADELDAENVVRERENVDEAMSEVEYDS